MPAGNVAFSASAEQMLSFKIPVTVETKCITWLYFSTCINCTTSTVPGLQTLPRSFLPRSTNIKCSAFSLGSFNNSIAIFSSSTCSFDLGRVPAIGCIIAFRSFTVTNASGLDPMISNSVAVESGVGIFR